MGLDEDTIRYCEHTCYLSLVESINLVLYLNGSDFEVEEVKVEKYHPRPAPSETQVAWSAHSLPAPSTYPSNESVHLYPPAFPHVLSSGILMAAIPEPRCKMAATPESQHKMAATSEPCRKMAASTSEPRHKMATATSEPCRKMVAATSEPRRKMVAATPEPSVKMASATPEPSVTMAATTVMNLSIPNLGGQAWGLGQGHGTRGACPAMVSRMASTTMASRMPNTAMATRTA
ncbi:uncharacterized protein LOC125252223 [Megalobrama amblycephala]|uniref:uncharacterized protein LOC125252223 n=1 Tax=Megalobrama amblycephala TaxID=75352 RepID=UPI0020142A3C|nr:uncharacterized protein LOC125252223 [Megalobrama amblycephala]